jgi:hypothetical protein
LIKEKDAALTRAYKDAMALRKERDLAIARWDAGVSQRKAVIAILESELASIKKQLGERGVKAEDSSTKSQIHRNRTGRT